MASPDPLHHGQPLQIARTHDYPGVVVCCVSGEVDAWSSPLLDEELQRAVHDARDLVVDLSKVTFFAVAGLNALERARDAAAPARDVVLADETDAVARVLDVPAMRSTFPRYPTVPAAVAACSRAS